MLAFDKQQFDSLRQTVARRFEDEMLEHFSRFAPRLFKIRGEQGIREVIRLGMVRAEDCGFSNRGPMRFYIELMFSFGCSFDTDPQYPWAGELLRDPLGREQMYRAEKLHERVAQYFEQVVGKDNGFALNALQWFKTGAINQYLVAGSGFRNHLLSGLGAVYPQKFNHVGVPALEDLYERAVEVAARHDLPEQPAAGLIAALMFGFGHGIADDPLYPWVGECLADQSRPPSERLRRLHRKTMTYVGAIIKHFES